KPSGSASSNPARNEAIGPASLTLPVTDGSRVSRSNRLDPVSLASATLITGATRSGPRGTAARTIVRVRSLELPARSVARTLNSLSPSARATSLNENAPVASATVVAHRSQPEGMRALREGAVCDLFEQGPAERERSVGGQTPRDIDEVTRGRSVKRGPQALDA